MPQASERKGTELELIAFSLSECLVDVEEDSAKYLRAVHRTALELAIPNCFGIDIGGFWLMANQLAELRRLPDFYPRHEAPLVMRAVEAYITAQIFELSNLRVRDLTVQEGDTVLA
ncbi:MAG: hypothetical protein ACRD8U_03730 [Pyrinomonadaceae bacterium]